MKKIALVLAVLLCALPMMAFAELAVSGSVSFSIGDDSTSDTKLPAFSGASSATGSVSLATDDEKVVATVGFDLMPAITVAAEEMDIYAMMATTAFDEVVSYRAWEEIEALVGFFNDHAEDKDKKTGSKKTIWGTDAEKELQTALDVETAVNLFKTDGDKANKINLMKPVSSAATTVDAKSEFKVTPAIETALIDLVDGTADAFDAVMAAQVDEAVEIILALCTDETLTDIGYARASLAADYNLGDLATDLNSLLEDEVKNWTADERALVKQAYDLENEYIRLAANIDTYSPEVTATLSFVTSASLAFKDIAGVIDVTCNLLGTHVAAGAITVDGNGHVEDAVAGYPSLMVGLSSGVVEGLNAGVTLYIDDNDVQNAVSDTWYTWLDDSEDEDVPVYGLGVNAGYSIALGDMTVGATGVFGMYDLAGDKAWAFSVAPSFSGFGANVGVQFDMGLDMTYLMACVDYTIMGITPSVAFHYANATGDNVLAYNDDPGSVMATYKNGTDGMLLGAGLAVDLTELIGMGISVNGGLDLGLTGAAKSEYAWNAGLAVAGLVDGLTVGFDCDADTVDGSKFDYAVSASYVYGAATLSASLGSDWDAAEEEDVFSWSVGTSVSF